MELDPEVYFTVAPQAPVARYVTKCFYHPRKPLDFYLRRPVEREILIANNHSKLPKTVGGALTAWDKGENC
jgi:hypothetical protein